MRTTHDAPPPENDHQPSAGRPFTSTGQIGSCPHQVENSLELPRRIEGGLRESGAQPGRLIAAVAVSRVVWAGPIVPVYACVDSIIVVAGVFLDVAVVTSAGHVATLMERGVFLTYVSSRAPATSRRSSTFPRSPSYGPLGRPLLANLLTDEIVKLVCVFVGFLACQWATKTWYARSACSAICFSSLRLCLSL